MKLETIYNACCIYESEQGYKLMSDPWFTDGAFEGSWFHGPEFKKPSKEVIASMDALYISHLHPDHYDPIALSEFRKDIPVFILKSKLPVLRNGLKGIGFTNIIEIETNNLYFFHDFGITLYGPFTTHPWDSSVLGSMIDSAMVISDNKSIVLNANDNTVDEKACDMLLRNHGSFDLVQLKHCAAGPYPSCFINLSHAEKLAEKERLLLRYEEHCSKIAGLLKAGAVEEFAGSYYLQGNIHWKNEYLAIRNLNAPDMNPEIEYDYQKDENLCWEDMPIMLPIARAQLWKWQEKFNFFPNYNMSIRYDKNKFFEFNFNEQNWAFIPKNIMEGHEDLICYMDQRLLYRILTKRSHWNNAEVGCHIDFDRKGPYMPDISIMMSFFHE